MTGNNGPMNMGNQVANWQGGQHQPMQTDMGNWGNGPVQSDGYQSNRPVYNGNTVQTFETRINQRQTVEDSMDKPDQDETLGITRDRMVGYTTSPRKTIRPYAVYDADSRGRYQGCHRRMKTINLEPKTNVPIAKATMMPSTESKQLDPAKETGKFFGSIVTDTDANVLTVKERTEIAWPIGSENWKKC
uniref:Uncharacterized protein n=1 Tax=Ditylenchus dipsaci TaxID=166011 RepID=A0A915CU77_9BILA